jgi:hypothetical protein
LPVLAVFYLCLYSLLTAKKEERTRRKRQKKEFSKKSKITAFPFIKVELMNKHDDLSVFSVHLPNKKKILKETKKI